MIKINERADRLKKLEELKKSGINPFPAKVKRDQSVSQVLADFNDLEKKQTLLSLAGRLRSLRGHGNLTFASLDDGSGKIQLFLNKKNMAAEKYR